MWIKFSKMGGNLTKRDKGHGVVSNLHGNQIVGPTSNMPIFPPLMDIHLRMVEQMSMVEQRSMLCQID